jgi:uncharacterized low-complexity protein
MVLRICFAALLAAILVAASVPTLVQSTSPAYAAAKEKEKAAKKEPSAKQKAARQRMKDCGAEWQGLKKSKKTEGKTWRAFSKECLSRK